MLTFLIVATLATEPASASAPTDDSLHDRLLAAADHGLSVSVADGLLTGAVGMVLRPRLRVPLERSWPTLSLQMARPQLRVAAWEGRVKLFVQPELADTVRLLDAEITIKPYKAFGVRAGRFVTAFSRSFYTPVPRLKFPDFAGSNAFFRVDRDVGGSIVGEAGPLEWEASVVTGQSTVPNVTDRARFLALARLNAHLLGRVAYDENRCSLQGCELGLAVGANANYQRYERRSVDPTNPLNTLSLGEEQRANVGLDAALTAGWFQLQVEAYYRGTHAPNGGARTDAVGAYLHASYAVLPHFFELAVRGDVLDPSLSATNDRIYSFDALATGYVLGEHAKLWLQYALKQTVGSATTHALLMQAQFWL